MLAQPGRTRVLTDRRVRARIQQRRLPGSVRGNSRDKEHKGGPAGKAASAGKVDTGMRLVCRAELLVAHAGMPTDALDSFPRSQLSRKKAPHAPLDDEGLFILQLQVCKYVEVVPGRVAHMSMVRIPARLSMRASGRIIDIWEREEAGGGEQGYVRHGLARIGSRNNSERFDCGSNARFCTDASALAPTGRHRSYRQ